MSTPAVSNIKGTGYQQVSMPKLSPEQQQLFSQVFGSLSPHLGGAVQGLGRLAAGDEEMFQGLEAPALNQYQKLIGGIGARFSGLGSGAQRSSAFQNALTGSAGELAERLQGQRLGLQQNAIKELLGLYGNLMATDQYDSFLQPKNKQSSFWQKLLGGSLPVIGAGVGGLFGGPVGAGLGGQLGGSLGSAFFE